MLCVSPVPSQAGSGDVGEPEEEEEEPGVPGDLAPGSQGDRAGSGCLGIAHRHKPTVTPHRQQMQLPEASKWFIKELP